MSFGADPAVTAAATPGFPYEPGADRPTLPDRGGASTAVPPGVSFVDYTAPPGAYPYGEELVNQGWSGNLPENVQEWTANRGDEVPGWTDESWSQYVDQSSPASLDPPAPAPSLDFLDVQPYTYDDSSSFDTSDMLSTMDNYVDESYNWAE
jgi:hypothetical protein